MPRRIVVAGASGLIGSALVAALRADGTEVTALVRRPAQAPHEVAWLDGRTPLDPDVLAGADAVVGLNGATIGRFPWTKAYRSQLLWSRLTPTRTLATAVRALGADAPAFVSASAVGFYGSVPGMRLDETSPRGRTFLADLVGEWEAAAAAAGPHVRVALLRTAPVVHPRGVLAPLITLTRAGVAGPLGRGTQSWPWISLDDAVRAIRHVIDTSLTGAVNVCGPHRATANDLGFALAVALNRPFLVRAPAMALRGALGRDAVDALLCSDLDVAPAALESSGFAFRHPHVEDAVAAAVALLR